MSRRPRKVTLEELLEQVRTLEGALEERARARDDPRYGTCLACGEPQVLRRFRQAGDEWDVLRCECPLHGDWRAQRRYIGASRDHRPARAGNGPLRADVDPRTAPQGVGADPMRPLRKTGGHSSSNRGCVPGGPGPRGRVTAGEDGERR